MRIFIFKLNFSLFLIVCCVGLSIAQLQLIPFCSTPAGVTEITTAPNNKLFIVQQNGKVFTSDLLGNISSQPFLDISSVVKSGGEQGLLGMEFSPEFHTDSCFYVNYTNLHNNNVVARYKINTANGWADPNSAEVLFEIEQPFTNHNGGCIKFGPDNFLYIASGDGGAGGDPLNSGQDLSSRLGKILRVDVMKNTGYYIPSSNPFFYDTIAEPMIWSLGLRNPWKFSFDAVTGDMWIGDVGQNQFEEIDYQPASSTGGENYGWRCFEGFTSYNPAGCISANLFTEPVHVYSHAGACSITGGFVYRGALHPNWYGKYIYTDYCSGEIMALENIAGTWTNTSLGVFNTFVFSTFGQDSYGELYIGKTSSGVLKLRDTLQCKPVADLNLPDSVTACGNHLLLNTPNHPDLMYQWYKDQVLIPGVHHAQYKVTASGSYKVQVSNNGCSTMSDPVYVDFYPSIPAQIVNGNIEMCVDAKPFKPSAAPSGGLLQGPGVLNGWFYPDAAGPGTHKIIYSYNTTSGCVMETYSYFRIDSCSSSINSSAEIFSIGSVSSAAGVQLIFVSDPGNGSRLQIVDMLGQIVKDERLDGYLQGDELYVNMLEIPSGVYVIKISKGTISQAEKLFWKR